MKEISKESVTWLEIDESGDQQRIDNFLIKSLKGVPKSHIYRILRSGEVRVNSGRIDASYRLQIGDKVRIPPIRVAQRPVVSEQRVVTPVLDDATLYEDDALLIINKPSGMAVHGGSGISRGVIEQIRLERPELKFIELVHRLDRETSGVLMLAKKRSALTKLQDVLREGGMDKRYLTLVKGNWRDEKRNVRLPLFKYLTDSGERRVSVQDDGKPSHTIFRLRQAWKDFSLLEAELKTGRTHQIRVHLAHLNFPIAGDDKYGDFALNKSLQKLGLKRMFLHAYKLTINHPLTGDELQIEAPLPIELQSFLQYLDKN
ncbi:RluA family pseudouridine synthase [Sulfurirhabdus autotrophica]|uniref:Pseudouridine synthase n=1 Tax=Sulfurirhabdus autotrophica TaxID=1706046 RepID=A0A4R3YDX8_9PROT|nr:RluA family pseudouridine synthase [Sulfurirhabdus autotrophica]TCV90052.1 23S rRNA pseudouridine955/2504/2580 synthase [Sulfurirhabdus autotrophica]